MNEITRTDSGHKDFIALVTLLDAHLSEKDGSEHSFYAQFNKIDKLKHVVVIYENKIPVACGAIKEFDQTAMEVKRMFTQPEFRGKGFASMVLKELEGWAAEMGYAKCILETGKRMPDAIALYKRQGYQAIPNYGQYAGVENSCCFEKELQIVHQ